jgi:hypothetical protein
MSELLAKALEVFPDCPNRDHDPYRVVGRPCGMCAASGSFDTARQALLDQNAKLQADNEQLRRTVVALEAANTKIKAVVDRVCGELLRCTSELRAERAQRDDEARGLLAEIVRLQGEVRKLHAPIA